MAIETPRGLLVACLRATGRQVYPINPMAVARYRDRHSIAGKKSDHGDSVVLANVLRTDLHAHRPLPADTELAQAIAVLARAQQDAVWDRTTAHNKLRSHLREYYPGFLAAFAAAHGGITRPEARTILAAAPTPAQAAALTTAQLRALLRKAGRSRGIDTEAARLRETFRAPQMRQLPLVEQAMGRQALALLGQLNAACDAAAGLEQAVTESDQENPRLPQRGSGPQPCAGLRFMRGSGVGLAMGGSGSLPGRQRGSDTGRSWRGGHLGCAGVLTRTRRLLLVPGLAGALRCPVVRVRRPGRRR